MNQKKSQVWVETAIYTLIGLTIIAVLLTAATPQIQKVKDSGVIKQTRDAMLLLNSKIIETEQSPGVVRIVHFKLSKGSLRIDAENNKIYYVLEDSRLELSEPGEEIKEGVITLKTEEYGQRYNIILSIDYGPSINITNNGETGEEKILHPGSIPHEIKIENIGDNGLGPTHLDFNVIS